MSETLSEVQKAAFDEVIRAEYARRGISYKPHPKQLAFHEAGKYAKERMFKAGNRSGKTLAVSNEVKSHATGIYSSTWNGYVYTEPLNIWVVGRSSAVVRDTLQKQYYLGDPDKGTVGLVHPSLIVDIKPARGVAGLVDTFYVKHSSGGVSKISFKSSEQGREKFQGDKVNIIHVDEECPISIYNECLIRTTATEPGFYGMIVVSMTPLKGRTELVCRFVEDRQPEIVQDGRWHIIASMYDNPHISPEEIAILESGMTENEREARIFGNEWIGSGLVYPLPEAAYLVDDFEIPDSWPRVFGMDFGWTKPTALVFGAYDRANDVVYLYAEYSVCQTAPPQHVNDLMQFGVNWMPGVYDPSGDNSSQINGEKLAPLYREAGMKNISPADNDTHTGTLTVLKRLRSDRLKIFKNLRKTRIELQKYSYDENGKILKKDDHLMDAMRYLVMSGIQLAIPKNYQEMMNMRRYGTRAQQRMI